MSWGGVNVDELTLSELQFTCLARALSISNGNSLLVERGDARPVDDFLCVERHRGWRSEVGAGRSAVQTWLQ